MNVLRIVGAIEAGLFGVLWFALGIGVFVWAYSGEIENRRRLAAIESGQVAPTTLRTVGLHDRRDGDDGPWIEIGTGRGEILTTFRVSKLDGLTIDEPVVAYRFGDDYYIPRFAWFPAWAKYVPLAFALLPVAVSAVLYLRRGSTRRPLAVKTHENDGTAP